MPVLRTKIETNLFNHSLKLIDHREQPSRSWTKHLFDLWYVLAGYNSNTLAGINDITPASRNLGTTANQFSNLRIGSAPGGVHTPILNTWNGPLIPETTTMPMGDIIGIQIGSNNTAPAPTDDKLNTRILHGETGGTLLYGGCELYGFSFVNPNGSFKIRRYFTNASGGNVVIREAGLYSPGRVSDAIAYLFCICRDVFADVTLPDTQILSVVYTVQITV